jgi:transketolase
VPNTPLDELCINTIRFLAVDGVEKANSGHPGAPMGMAAIAYTLWTKHMRFNPKNPDWFDRDRFILSNGHASMLLYSILHLTGYDVSTDDLKKFRQWRSKTPGHPERGFTPGVEVTTGPLGQGFANGVGMGIADQFLASTFNKEDLPITGHYTYVFLGDGCLMEGITSEAASLAGHLELGKLIYFYDSNHISIDGSTDLTFTEDVALRFKAYGWQVLVVKDGNDVAEIDDAISAAKNDHKRPSMIICNTVIGYGSPKKAGTSKAHGSPLGKDEVRATREAMGWPLEPTFHVPDEAREVFEKAGANGAEFQADWTKRLKLYREKYPQDAKAFDDAISNRLPEQWDADMPVFQPGDGPMATRNAGGKALNSLAARVPTMITGSADLNESCFTKFDKYPEFGPHEHKHGQPQGRTVNFGVREHAMAAMINGMAAHGGVYPSGSTFFTFSDYMRPSVRLAALMNVPSVFVWTHDSVGLGEDGPTHQPVEHLASLRAMPNFTVIRPGDANETVEAWRVAMRLQKPCGIVLSRQKLPILDLETFAPPVGLEKGAYIKSNSSGEPKIILIASGSELSLALDAQEILEKNALPARVVSMPSWELFEAREENYRELVLPADIPKLSIELGSTQGWHKWVGDNGASMGVDTFGTSAPYEKILEEYGFTAENVAAIAKLVIDSPKVARKQIEDRTQKLISGHISSAPATGSEGHS